MDLKRLNNLYFKSLLIVRLKCLLLSLYVNIFLKFESLLIIFTLERNIKFVNTPTTKFVKQLFNGRQFFFLIDRSPKNLNRIVFDS